MSANTSFTTDWSDFQERLTFVLNQLARRSSDGAIRLIYPTGGDGAGTVVVLETAVGGATSDIGLDPRSLIPLAGVSVRLPGRPPRFYVLEDEDAMAEPAHDTCEFLRDAALVAHPSLLTAEADGSDPAILLPLLELPEAAAMPLEMNGRRAPRRVARRGPAAHAELTPGSDSIRVVPSREVVWPESIEEVAEAVEEVLSRKYGGARVDDDGDYVIEAPEAGGARFYLTLITDRPMIMFRKAAVLTVDSRRSAIIEANYLNRESTEIRWVLRGYTLYQELSFPTAPFVPARFTQMLDEFAARYRESVSALQLRLDSET